MKNWFNILLAIGLAIVILYFLPYKVFNFTEELRKLYYLSVFIGIGYNHALENLLK